MIDHGKHNVLGIGVNAVDYESALEQILSAARDRRSLAVSALAVHGVMTGVLDEEHRHRLNHFDLIVPDGQPVRWALRWLHGVRLAERVYGPTLTLRVCEQSAARRLPVYLYGSKPEVLERLTRNLKDRFAGLEIAGSEPSRFRRLSASEKEETAERIRCSGAAITLVGLGCPRQEVWVYEYRDLLPMPLLAVGAAFDFHAGNVPQAPPWMQRRGLEWLYRLSREPKRLWKRYLFLNPYFLTLLGLQALRMKRFSMEQAVPPLEELRYG